MLPGTHLGGRQTQRRWRSSAGQAPARGASPPGVLRLPACTHPTCLPVGQHNRSCGALSCTGELRRRSAGQLSASGRTQCTSNRLACPLLQAPCSAGSASRPPGTPCPDPPPSRAPAALVCTWGSQAVVTIYSRTVLIAMSVAPLPPPRAAPRCAAAISVQVVASRRWTEPPGALSCSVGEIRW